MSKPVPKKIKVLIAELTDPDPCQFDHDGGCQAHGYIFLESGQTCPVGDAQRLLEEWGMRE